jgi:hypothetical protein
VTVMDLLDTPNIQNEISDADLKFLKEFPKLKSFGNSKECFTSLEAVLQYRNDLSPIKLSVLNLLKIGDALQNDDLKKLAENFKDLNQLLIRSSKIKSIPFESLEYLDCDNCINLTSIDAPNATTVHCIGCKSDMILNVPINCEIVREIFV